MSVEPRLHNTIRVAIARYNAANNTNYKATNNNGVLTITECAAEPVAQPESVGTVEHPSKFEFIAYLSSLQDGESFKMQEQYKDRFEQFAEWVDEYKSKSKNNVDCDVVDNELIIAKGKVS